MYYLISNILIIVFNKQFYSFYLINKKKEERNVVFN